MIKVNLLRDSSVTGVRIKSDETQYGVSPHGLTQGGVGSSSSVVTLLKVVALALPLLGLMYWEKQNLDRLRAEQKDIQNQYNEVSEKLNTLSSQSFNLPELEKKIEENNKTIDSVENIIATRLTEVKALDHIQAVLPEKLWLENLDYKEGRLVLKGLAFTSKELDVFLKELEGDKNIFRDIVVLKTQDRKVDNRDLQEFEISCTLGEGS